MKKGIRDRATRDANNRALGAEIRRIRGEKALTQRKLAEMVGTTTATISKIEAGKQGLDLTVLQKLSRCLEFSVYRVLATVQEKNTPKDSARGKMLELYLTGLEQLERIGV